MLLTHFHHWSPLCKLAFEYRPQLSENDCPRLLYVVGFIVWVADLSNTIFISASRERLFSLYLAMDAHNEGIVRISLADSVMYPIICSKLSFVGYLPTSLVPPSSLWPEVVLFLQAGKHRLLICAEFGQKFSVAWTFQRTKRLCVFCPKKDTLQAESGLQKLCKRITWR